MFGLPKIPWGFLGVAGGTDTRPNNSLEDMSALTAAYKAAHLRKPAPVGAQNYSQAQADLQLTPQERSLYERHLKNLNGPGGVDNPDGSRSTLFQASVDRNGRTYNIPTVYDGKILPARDAMARAEAAGWDNFPSYGSQAEAEARYKQMHGYMDKDTAEHMANKGAYANARVSRGFDQFGPQPTPPRPIGPPASPFDGSNTPSSGVLSSANLMDPRPTAVAPSVPPAAAAPAVPMPTPRPAAAPAPTPDMGFFQRNAAMMRDPSSGTFIDPVNAERAQASGPDVINKLLGYFHTKDT